MNMLSPVTQQRPAIVTAPNRPNADITKEELMRQELSSDLESNKLLSEQDARVLDNPIITINFTPSRLFSQSSVMTHPGKVIGMAAQAGVQGVLTVPSGLFDAGGLYPLGLIQGAVGWKVIANTNGASFTVDFAPNANSNGTILISIGGTGGGEDSERRATQ